MAAKFKIEKRGYEILIVHCCFSVSQNELKCSNLGTFWLKIEQFWPFEEISIFSNSGHLEWRAGLSDIILKGTHPGTIHCSYMARSSLAYIPGFFCEIFLSADIYRLCKLGIF
jgi:hypothetical protein